MKYRPGRIHGNLDALSRRERKHDDCIIAGEGEGGVMESRENKLRELCTCVDIKNTIKFLFIALHHIS